MTKTKNERNIIAVGRNADSFFVEQNSNQRGPEKQSCFNRFGFDIKTGRKTSSESDIKKFQAVTKLVLSSNTN